MLIYLALVSASSAAGVWEECGTDVPDPEYAYASCFLTCSGPFTNVPLPNLGPVLQCGWATNLWAVSKYPDDESITIWGDSSDNPFNPYQDPFCCRYRDDGNEPVAGLLVLGLPSANFTSFTYNQYDLGPTIHSPPGDAFTAGFTGVVWGKEGDDYIVGSNSAGTDLRPYRYQEILMGDAGSDTIFGMAGADLISGAGPGYPSRDLNECGLSDTIDFLYGGDGDDMLIGCDGDDTIEGNAGIDELRGGGGEDTLYGNLGGDTIDGGDEGDTLFGGQGEDTISGGKGVDQIAGDMHSDTIDGEGERDVIYGGSYGDIIEGGPGADQIFGEQGTDVLSGNGDNDTIHGGDDDDEINGNNGEDTLFGDRGIDTLWGGDLSDRLEGGPENDELIGGDGVDVLLGGPGEDLLRGLGDDDLLDGQDDGDILWGGAGIDAMYGGMGPDTLCDDNNRDLYIGGDAAQQDDAYNQLFFQQYGGITTSPDCASDATYPGSQCSTAFFSVCQTPDCDGELLQPCTGNWDEGDLGDP